MDSGINIDYNQILNLIHQFPKKEIERLTITLQSEMESGKSSDSLQDMILNAPIWTDSELEDNNKARIHFKQSRIA